MLSSNSRGRIHIALGTSVMEPPGIHGYVQGTAEVTGSWSRSASERHACLEFDLFSGSLFQAVTVVAPHLCFQRRGSSEDTAKVPRMSLADLAWVSRSSQTADHFWEYLLICLPTIHSLFFQ